jgi:hypothetical protein
MPKATPYGTYRPEWGESVFMAEANVGRLTARPLRIIAGQAGGRHLPVFVGRGVVRGYSPGAGGDVGAMGDDGSTEVSSVGPAFVSVSPGSTTEGGTVRSLTAGADAGLGAACVAGRVVIGRGAGCVLVVGGGGVARVTT